MKNAGRNLPAKFHYIITFSQNNFLLLKVVKRTVPVTSSDENNFFVDKTPLLV